MTARNIIRKAMQKNGILTENEQPTAEQANDGLDSLNAMISSWSNDELLITARVTEQFSLQGGVASYTIGTGQTFSTERPNFIMAAYCRIAESDYPVISLSDEAFAQIYTKSTTGQPYWLNYNNAFPVGTIRLYPVPSQSFDFFIVSEKPINEFSSLDAEVNLSSGWERALIYNLGIELCPEYGQPISPDLDRLAKESKMSIKTAIARNRTMDWDNAPIGYRNINTGWNQ